MSSKEKISKIVGAIVFLLLLIGLTVPAFVDTFKEETTEATTTTVEYTTKEDSTKYVPSPEQTIPADK